MTKLGAYQYQQSAARFLVHNAAGQATRDEVAATLLDPRLARALELDTGKLVTDDELVVLRDMLETLHRRQQRRTPGLRKTTPAPRPADAAGTSYALPGFVTALAAG
jgi:hypothetical protein